MCEQSKSNCSSFNPKHRLQLAFINRPKCKQMNHLIANVMREERQLRRMKTASFDSESFNLIICSQCTSNGFRCEEVRFDAISDPNWYQLYCVIVGYADLPLVNTETAKKFVPIGQVSRSACMSRIWYLHYIRKNMRIVCPHQSRLHSIKRKGSNVENLFKCGSMKVIGDFPDQIFCHVPYFQILQGRVWRSACMRRRWYFIWFERTWGLCAFEWKSSGDE